MKEQLVVDIPAQDIQPVKYYDFNSLPEPQQDTVAHNIEAFTQQYPDMLTVSPKEVLQKVMGVVALDGSRFVGYTGVAAAEEHNGQPMHEIGTVCVEKDYRKQGIGAELVALVTKLASDKGMTLYAFCNDKSLPIFEKQGYEAASEVDVPKQALELCADCPLKPIKGCCDTIVLYNNQEEK